MSYSGCLSDPSLIRNATQCSEAHRKRLLYIAQYVSDELSIASACCSLHLRHQCFNSLVSDKCDKQAQKFVMDQTEGPYRSLISNVCAPYYLSVKACTNRIDPDVWHNMKLVTVNNAIYGDTAGELRNSSHGEIRNREEPEEEEGEMLHTKIEQLKFRESFLAMIFIIRRND